MRLNFFSRSNASRSRSSRHEHRRTRPRVRPPTGRTFPADEVVWGIVIRNGFDELDDPWYHRGTTQHAYLEGNDNVAICGFRPPQSGPRTRRRSRLGLPTAGEHPMCGMCARMVVAPRPRVPVPVQGSRPPVAVPVASAPEPAARATARRPVSPPRGQRRRAAAVPPAHPWPRLPDAPAAGAADLPLGPPAHRCGRAGARPSPSRSAASHDSGLLKRGVHTDIERRLTLPACAGRDRERPSDTEEVSGGSGGSSSCTRAPTRSA